MVAIKQSEQQQKKVAGCQRCLIPDFCDQIRQRFIYEITSVKKSL